MEYPEKSEIQFKQTPAYIQKDIHIVVCEYRSAPFSSVFTHSQIKLFLQMLKHLLSFSIPSEHLPPPAFLSQQFIFLDPRLQQTPYLWCYSVVGL